MTQVFDDVIRRLHLGVNPYSGFPVHEWKVDHWGGWDASHVWFAQSIDEIKPTLIVEVGSFKGGSAIHMATKLRGEGRDAAIICVDTWLAEVVLWTSPEWRPSLLHRHGRPEIYNTFLANVIDCELDSYIVPLPMDSAGGARLLHKLGLGAQLIYIDGSHQAGDVYRDIDLYWNLILESGGVMLLDDFQNPGTITHVADDLRKFCGERGLTFETNGMKARIRKNSTA